MKSVLPNRLHGTISLIMTVLILIYSLGFDMMPTHETIKRITAQNALLKTQVQTKKKALQKAEPGLSSQAFYAWFIAQSFANLKLLTLAGDQQNMHITLEGDLSSLIAFLQDLNGSRFASFSLTDIQEQSAHLDIYFTLLAIDKKSPLLVISPLPSITHAIAQGSKIIGAVQRKGERFCVVELGDKIVLRRGKC